MSQIYRKCINESSSGGFGVPLHSRFRPPRIPNPQEEKFGPQVIENNDNSNHNPSCLKTLRYKALNSVTSRHPTWPYDHCSDAGNRTQGLQFPLRLTELIASFSSDRVLPIRYCSPNSPDTKEHTRESTYACTRDEWPHMCCLCATYSACRRLLYICI